MKRFLIQTAIFSVFIFALVFALDEITFSDAFIKSKTDETEYSKIAWNFHMLNNKPELIEGSTIFMGSSLVQGAVNDSIAHSKGLKVYNFALPHNGYDLNLYFVNRIKKLKPKSIFFLQEKNNYKGLHKLTPLLNRPSNLLRWGQKINFHFANYFFKRAKLSLEYLVFSLKDKQVHSSTTYKDYGIVFDNKPFKSGTRFEDAFLKKLSKRDEYLNLYQNEFLYAEERDDFDSFKRLVQLKRKAINTLWVSNNLITNYKSQQEFLEEAEKIIGEENIIFSKIYVPVLSDVVKDSERYERSYFSQKKSDSVISLGDFYFLNSPIYWSDEAHVNEEGARVFSEKLFESYRNSPFLAKK